jgi:DNA-binding winged helix-turn-helix (wHTH) protein
MRLTFDDYVLDATRRELRRGSDLVAIEPQVFDLLAYLVQNPDRVVTRDELLQAVWDGRIVSESAIANRINAARRAIGDSGDAQHLIRTVPRKGFRFVGAVKEDGDEKAEADVRRGIVRRCWRAVVLVGTSASLGAAIFSCLFWPRASPSLPKAASQSPVLHIPRLPIGVPPFGDLDIEQSRARAELQWIPGEGHVTAGPNPRKVEPAQLVAAVMPAPARVLRPEVPGEPPAAPAPNAAADASGLYRGQICEGQGGIDPARYTRMWQAGPFCYNTVYAVVQHNQISGQWPGRNPGVTMHVAGDVSASGEVAILMHAVRDNESHSEPVKLIGTFRDGRIDAMGAFRNGRQITLNWHKD